MSAIDSPGRRNRPGLSAIEYRTGVHGEILQRMLNRLHLWARDNGTRPLAELSTRDRRDATVALLDAWAATLDVLSFYQERLANEWHVGTARDRRSVVELARAIGYELQPGLSASARLAFTLEDAPGSPREVRIPKGTQIMSVPGQDETPQVFETSRDFDARAAWNRLRLQDRLFQDFETGMTELYVEGLTPAAAGDILLFLDEGGDPPFVAARALLSVETRAQENRARLAWAEGLAGEGGGPLPERIEVYVFSRKARLFGRGAPLWRDLPPDEQLKQAGETVAEATDAAFSPDGALAAVVSLDGRLRLWNVRAGALLAEVVAHGGAATGVAFSPDGARLATVGADGRTRLWRTGGLAPELDQPVSPPATGVAFSPAGDRWMAFGGDGALKFWDLAGGRLQDLQASQSPVRDALFLDGDWIAVAGEDRKLALLGADLPTVALGECDEAVTALAGLAGAERVHLLAGGAGGGLWLWTLSALRDYSKSEKNKRNRWWASPERFDMPGGVAHRLRFHPRVSGDDPEFYTAGSDGALLRWRLSRNEHAVWPEIQPYAGPLQVLHALDVSGDGGQVIAAGSDGAARVWRADTAVETANLYPSASLSEWPDFLVEAGPVDLDAEYDGIAPGSWIVLHDSDRLQVVKIDAATAVARDDFLLRGAVTRLNLAESVELGPFDPRQAAVLIHPLRLEPSEWRALREDPARGDRLDLNAVIAELQPQHPLFVSGKRARVRVQPETGPLQLLKEDGSQQLALTSGETLTVLRAPEAIEDGARLRWPLLHPTGFNGLLETSAEAPELAFVAAAEDEAPSSEFAILKNLFHVRRYSVLQLEQPLQRILDRNSVVVYANVVEATHGETVEEVLGSGDGSAVNQVFTLKNAPLTYTPSELGAESSLSVRVDGVLWREVANFLDMGPRDQVFMTRSENDGSVQVIFGDGERGARLPTGQENVTAVYRKGSGKVGEVAAESLILPRTRPLGVAETVNPLPAAGASSAETLDGARVKAPLSTLTLGRIVSARDFQSFALAYPGVDKAYASTVHYDNRSLAHVTVAGEEGAPIPPDSALYANLIAAMNAARDPYEEMRVDSYAPLFFNVAAKLNIDERYLPDRVFEAAEAALRVRFVFAVREFAQDVSASEIISVLQAVEGVIAVDLDHLYRNDLTAFSLDTALQDELDRAGTLSDALRAALDEGLVAGGREKLGAEAGVTVVKAATRWLVADATAVYALAKSRGKINGYPYQPEAAAALSAEPAVFRDGAFQPAQLLLLNPDTIGVVLTEFEE